MASLPSNRSPEREAILKEIQICVDFVEGESAVKARNKEYLWPFDASMTDEAYKIYKMESQLPEFTSTFHQSLVGAMLRRDPKVALPATASWITDNFGDRGQGLMLWMSEVLDRHLITTNEWIFIDYPVVKGDLSRADVEKQNVRPYPIHVTAESILEASSELINSKEVLTEFRYEKEEPKEGSAEFDYSKQKRIVRLYVEDGVAYRQDYVDDQKDGTRVTFVQGGKNLSYIPIFSLNGQIKPVIPLLLKMANTDKHAYNKKSRRNHYGLLMGTTTITTAGLDKSDRDLIGGMGGIWHAGDINAKFGTISLDVGVINGYKIMLDEDTFTAAAIGARMFTEHGKEAQSGTALAIKNASSYATLGYISTVFSKIISDILKFVILWDSKVVVNDTDVVVELSKDFIPEVLNGTDMTALVGARLQNVIPDRVFFDALKRGELIGDDYTYQQFRDELDAQLAVEPDNDDTPPQE